jgi:preprotein translocase subunit SecF
MDLIKHRYLFLGVSAVITLVSILALVFFNLKPGIDLRGGTQWQFTLGRDASESAVLDVFFKTTDIRDIAVRKANDGSFMVRLPNISSEQKVRYEESLTRDFDSFTEKNYSNIGPSIGSELRQKAILAIIFVLFGISIYIAFAFRKVSRPISSWKYGFVTLLTLFHDVVIPAGLLAVLGKFKGIEIDTNFIVALLVVMGFSVHDTIVVFDRIRENILLTRGKNISLKDVINASVRETLVRSINTSLTLFIVLFALMFFGPPSLFYFVLVILVGTFFGMYSSIFVASPLLYEWDKWHQKGKPL